MDTTQEAIYAQAEQLTGYNALSLKAMALWAYENRKNKEAMRIASFVWQRNARTLAKAVDCFSEYFRYAEPMGGQSPYGVDTYLSLFTIATLPDNEMGLLFEQWRNSSMQLFEVRDAVASRKQRKSKATKEPTLADKLQTFICELEKESECGAGLELVCQRRAIADQLRGLLA